MVSRAIHAFRYLFFSINALIAYIGWNSHGPGPRRSPASSLDLHVMRKRRAVLEVLLDAFLNRIGHLLPIGGVQNAFSILLDY